MMFDTTFYTVEVDNTYAWVLLMAVLTAFETVLIGFLAVGGARRQAFPHTMMDEKWGRKHYEAL